MAAAAMISSACLNLGLGQGLGHGPGTGWGWRVERTRRQELQQQQEQHSSLSVTFSRSRFAAAPATVAPQPTYHAAIVSACYRPLSVGSLAAAAAGWICNSLPPLHLHLPRRQQQENQHQGIDHLRIRVKASESSSSATMAVESDPVTREPATGIEFPNAATTPGASVGSLALVGTGFREKQVAFFKVKVYAVALYVDTSSLGTKAEGGSDDGRWGGEWKGKPAKELEENESFFKALAELPVEKALKMVLARDVEGSQFWQALDEALTWRLKEAAAGPAGDEALAKLGDVVKGVALKKGAGVFLTWVQPSSLKISIIAPGAEAAAGDVSATIDSAVLLSCLFDVYLGKKSVSPSIKASIARTFPL